MTPEQIAETIRQQLAEKDRSDLDQLGRAQTQQRERETPAPEPDALP